MLQSFYTSDEALLQHDLHTATIKLSHTLTLLLRTHFLITGADLLKTITQLIKNSLVDECIKHTSAQTQPHSRRGGELTGTSPLFTKSFVLSLSCVNSQWGVHAISGAAHSRDQYPKQNKKEENIDKPSLSSMLEYKMMLREDSSYPIKCQFTFVQRQKKTPLCILNVTSQSIP